MTYVLQGQTGDWEIVVGLEVHAQVISESKLFSGAATEFGAEPNNQVSFIDAGFPGMLPVINQHCVRQAVKTGLGLKAQINMESVFERKNYFYPDLPSGYQISQFEHPIVGEGEVVLDMPDGSTKNVGITRLHLETDAGKSMHDQHPSKSFIDLNRSGVALMEIVSEPDIRSPEEASAYLKKVRAILRYLETCDGNMEEGSMRCDANISVRKPGDEFGTRCEIKNVNSIRNVQLAIEYEAKRQIEVIEAGGTIRQETRLFDATDGSTRSMRSKEEAHDYRYFPDPDLLPLVLEQDLVEELKAGLPELPDEKKQRFITEFSLTNYDASVLTVEKEVADYFEEVAKSSDAKLAANWVTQELFGALNKAGKTLANSPIQPAALAELIGLIQDNTISGKIAKDVFQAMFETGEAPAKIVEDKGLKQITDTGALEEIVDTIISNNQGQVEQYKAGKDKVFGFFVGQVMKQTQGKANPGIVNELLKKKLAE